MNKTQWVILGILAMVAILALIFVTLRAYIG